MKNERYSRSEGILLQSIPREGWERGGTILIAAVVTVALVAGSFKWRDYETFGNTPAPTTFPHPTEPTPNSLVLPTPISKHPRGSILFQKGK